MSFVSSLFYSVEFTKEAGINKNRAGRDPLGLLVQLPVQAISDR